MPLDDVIRVKNRII